MKKTLFGWLIAAALILPWSPVQAAETADSGTAYVNPAGNPVNQFTGEYWLKSTQENKEAFLFGVDTAVTVEDYISKTMAEKAAKAGKKPVSMLSPFEKGWMEAFKDMTRGQIVEAVDKWYQDHPDELSRPVMSVIWYEVIKPRLAAKK